MQSLLLTVMARENTVFLYGIAMEKPKILVDRKTGQFRIARLELRTVRRRMRKELKLLGKNRYDQVVVNTKDEEIIKFIIKQEIKQGDMVFVKGTLTTTPSIKKFQCPHCKAVNQKMNATTVCVDPIFIGAWEQNFDHIERETRDLNEECSQTCLDGKYEISNMIFIWGYLCRDPDYYDEKRKECQFQIATDRKRRIDYSDEKTDYPWVKIYGERAEEASKVLKTGSEIYINGSLQTRNITKSMICDHCHELFDVNDQAIEIIPYSIEYGRNCDLSPLDEDTEEGDGVINEEE